MQKVRKLLVITIGMLMFSVVLSLTVHAATLSYWYSDKDVIGKWETSPSVWYKKIDQSAAFSFLSGLIHGADIWNAALGTSVTVSSSNSSAPIKYYGGTKEQLDALNLFDPVATDDLGCTEYTDTSYKGTHTFNGVKKSWYLHKKITGYVVSRTDMNANNYTKTASHEMGHAMGWRGHPSTDHPTWVMEQGILENKTLSTGEKKHLSQIY